MGVSGVGGGRRGACEGQGSEAPPGTPTRVHGPERLAIPVTIFVPIRSTVYLRISIPLQQNS